MKYAVEMDSGATTYMVPPFIKIVQAVKIY
jgi:hypothetical protein